MGRDDGRTLCAGGHVGTAALHTAVAAMDLEPGDEVITTTITRHGYADRHSGVQPDSHVC